MARPSPSSFDKSKQRNGLRVSAQLFMLIKDDPTNAIAVTDLQLGITVDEVKQFVSREFGIDPACFHLEDLNGSPLDGSFALCEGTLPENTYSVVCENPSDIPKFDLARFSEAPSEMDSQSERPRSPSSSSSASSSPSVFSPPHRRLQFSPPPPESFASQPRSISPSQSESPLVPPADERPLMLGSFFDVRSVRSGVTAASEYQGAGLLCEFSSLLLRDKVPEMVGICQGIPLPALLSSIPFLCGIDHPQVFEFLQRSCQTCPVFANRLFFFANERPAFQHLAPLLASIPTPPMLPYCIDGVASFQKGQVVEFHGSHPITSEPISGFRIDHVFSSLARPLIISFLPPTNQSSVDPPPSPCVSSSSSSSVNSSVSQQSSQPPSQPSSSLDHPGNALATESYCRVLMKFNEDIYHETAIQLLFKSMNEIWIDHLPPPLQPFVCSFRELPATPKLGFLQIVEGCLDLEVVELANFEQIQPSSRDNFVRTTCGWCLAAYLLGLSDRHRE
ncbi:MAG: hypothetical protein Q8P67_08145, partial [archaeon]|nr:hypothetical protein [archaeon]